MSFDCPISIKHSSCTNPDYGTCDPAERQAHSAILQMVATHRWQGANG